MLQILFLAAVAAVVLYQLYATLGRRVGRQPEETSATAQPNGGSTPLDTAPAARTEGLATLKAKQPDFDPVKFLTGRPFGLRADRQGLCRGSDRETAEAAAGSRG
ncbi:hypothetical protein ACRAWD_17065 [Caulobacter segnis]